MKARSAAPERQIQTPVVVVFGCVEHVVLFSARVAEDEQDEQDEEDENEGEVEAVETWTSWP